MSMANRAPDTLDSLGQRYGSVARLFHWLVVGLLVVQYVTKFVLPFILPKSTEDAVNDWHLSIGSTILLVMLLRLLWRLAHPAPLPPTDLSPGLRLLSRATHWLMYAVLIVLPVLGWVAASAYGATVRLFGFIPLPALTTPNKAFAESVGSVHGALALALLALIALHIAGSMYHAFVKRDGVVGRMLPG